MLVKSTSSRCMVVPADVNNRSVSNFVKSVEELIDGSTGELSLNCSQLQHVSSTHVSLLWQAVSICRRAGLSARLTSVGVGLARVLRILDLYDMFDIEKACQPDRERGSQDEGVLAAANGTEFEFEPRANVIKGIASEFRSFLQRLGIAEIDIFELETIFYEAVTNIRLHGRLCECDKITFKANLDSSVVSMRFFDPGPPFDPTASRDDYNPEEAIRSKRRRGLGITMIRRMTDEFAYERNAALGNILSMKKRVSFKEDT